MGPDVLWIVERVDRCVWLLSTTNRSNPGLQYLHLARLCFAKGQLDWDRPV